jgi:hypothetical protein
MDLGGGAGDGLGGEDDVLAPDAAQRRGGVRVGAVLVGQVPEGDAAIVGVAEQIHQPVEAEARLVRLPVPAVRAGSDAEPRDADAGIAEGDLWDHG